MLSLIGVLIQTGSFIFLAIMLKKYTAALRGVADSYRTMTLAFDRHRVEMTKWHDMWDNYANALKGVTDVHTREN